MKLTDKQTVKFEQLPMVVQIATMAVIFLSCLGLATLATTGIITLLGG